MLARFQKRLRKNGNCVRVRRLRVFLKLIQNLKKPVFSLLSNASELPRRNRFATTALDVACPGAGACGGQYTANTMSTVMEFIGLSPMGFNSVPALSPEKDKVALQCGEVIMNLLRNGVRPLDILTPNAFQNAIASVATTSGSTNAVLHLLAIAREAGVPLNIDDFQAVSERTPILADLKPSGRFVAADVHEAGGNRCSPNACWNLVFFTAVPSRSLEERLRKKPLLQPKLPAKP